MTDPTTDETNKCCGPGELSHYPGCPVPPMIKSLRARVAELEAALRKVEHWGADGISEDGCAACHALGSEAEKPYTVAMQEGGIHLMLCPVGAALAKCTPDSVGPMQRPDDCNCDGFEPYTHYSHCEYITKKAKVSDAEHGSQGVRRVSGGDGVAVAVGEAHGRAASDVGTSGPGVAGGELPGSESVGVNDCRPSEVPSKDALCYHCGEPAVHKVDGHVYCDHCFRCHRDPRPNDAPCGSRDPDTGRPCERASKHEGEHGFNEGDPERCSACRTFVERNAPPKPRVVVKNELWDAAILKVRQLESEIRASGASDREKSNMLHTHSKLWMFATDAWEQEVTRPAQRRAADSDYPPAVVQLALAAHAVVKSRVPALSAEREGSDWKHSRISDSLTDKLATALEALGPCTANPTSKETP